jgi:hypothetical protein
MLVCQVATFSPLCITMSLNERAITDKHLINAYQFRLKFMPSDAKHSIFVSCKKGGIGIRSFVQEYMDALLRDVEVYISDTKSLTSHAILSSIEAVTKQHIYGTCFRIEKFLVVPVPRIG